MGGYLYNRQHRRRIATVLEVLDAPLLRANRCLFGGGTAITLRHGEYRESLNIDFLVSDLAGYRTIRQLAMSGGIDALAREPVRQLREVRADMYGIRTLLEVDGAAIKFEIIHEGRIVLDEPSETDEVCGVATLTPLDLATSKLLANADRWADRAVFSRDVIDLAMMNPTSELLRAAVAKALVPYGDSILSCLHKAINALREQPRRLDDSIRTLGMESISRQELWERVVRLETLAG